MLPDSESADEEIFLMHKPTGFVQEIPYGDSIDVYITINVHIIWNSLTP